jgi:hypothetical protein
MTKSFFASLASTARDVGEITTFLELQVRPEGASTSMTMNNFTISTAFPDDGTRSVSRVCVYEFYAYIPLVDMDIRLIRLRASLDETSMIEVDLMHVPLESAGELGYTALSYTWGSIDTSATILVVGKRFEVGSNVQSALIRLCRLEYIWVRTWHNSLESH